jgi:hypothetical protein
MVITKDTTIKELIFTFPAASSYFMKYNIKCLISGDARWGTIESTALGKDFSHEDVQRFVDELNVLYSERQMK